jgi:hypothetical protein
MRIWKYKLEINDFQEIETPSGGEILTAQMQGNELQLWVLVNENSIHKTTRKIAIYGTGNPMPESCGKYISTFQLHNGALVFHVFELAR